MKSLSTKQLAQALKSKRAEFVSAIELIDEAIPALQLLDEANIDVQENGASQKRTSRKSFGAHCSPGEMREAIWSAVRHHDGKPVSAFDVAKYINKHRPASLRNRKIPFKSILKRTSDDLYRAAHVDQVMKIVGKRGRQNLYQRSK